MLSLHLDRERASKLSPSQEYYLKDEITRVTHFLKGGHLRDEDIRRLIHPNFKVDYGLPGIYLLLHRWQVLKDRFFNNRAYKSSKAIEQVACLAWNT